MKRILILFQVLLFTSSAYSQKFISRQKALDDLDFYQMTLEDVHYNPYQFVEKDHYMSAFNSMKASLEDSISLEAFMRKIYELSALMQDSHSAPSVFQSGIFSDEYKKPQFFPLHTIIHNNRLYVSPSSEYPSGVPAGSEILSINGVSAGSFIAGSQSLIGGLDEYKREFVNRLLSHFLFMNGIKASFEIEYKDPGGRVSKKTGIEGISYVKSLLVTMPGLLKGNSFKIIDEKIGYMDFCNMNGSWQDFGHFVDSAITVFKKNNISTMVVDLRNNSGGNSMLGDVLISYLTDEKYSLSGIKKWKISQQYKDYLVGNGNNRHQYLDMKNGGVWEMGDCEPQANNFTSQNKFEGKVYFLTGPFTFSSANMVAAGVKQYQLAEIIGEPTGENTNDFGEVYSFKLPNSGILMNITTSFDIGPACDPSIHAPVIPDVPIQVSLNELLKGEDKVLQYVLGKAG